MVVLEWATDEQQSKRPSLEDRAHLQQLQESLSLLLHRLLLGHMLDKELYIDHIVRCPCCPALALRWPWEGPGGRMGFEGLVCAPWSGGGGGGRAASIVAM